MCYHIDKRDTDERLPPRGYNEITPSVAGELWDGVISFFKKLLLLISARKSEDKCDDCNDNHAIGKQVFISNHLTTPIPGEVPSAVSGVPQGHNATVIIAYLAENASTYKIRLAISSRMCYHIDKRDTDERLPPRGYNEITPSVAGELWDGVISFFKKLLLLISARKSEDKCDDCNDNHAIGKQVFISNHLTTPIPGEVPSAVSGVPQGHNAAVIIAYLAENASTLSSHTGWQGFIVFWWALRSHRD